MEQILPTHQPTCVVPQLKYSCSIFFTAPSCNTTTGSPPNCCRISGGINLSSMLSLVSKQLKEVKEMKYEFEHDYLVDTSKYETLFGNEVTLHEGAVNETVEWYLSEMKVKI